MKKIAIGLGLIVVLAVIIGWAVGPDWRRLLADPPKSSDVLFWKTGQRDAGFRMLDSLSFIIDSRKIKAGQTPRALKQGPPLQLDIDALMKRQRYAGLIILHNGEIRSEAYGLDFSEKGRWTSFSVAKSFTSTLVGAAIKDGFISGLDAPVTDYVKGLKGSAYDQVTIEQLLTMSSGVAWDEDYDDPDSDVARFVAYQADDGLPNLVSYMKKLPRAHPAGEVWNYSTGETNLIGILVSDAVGKTLTQYLSEKIWIPAGMKDDGSWLLSDDGREISGCCIQATTRDFARFGQFMLDDARNGAASIVPDGWIKEATTKRIGINEPGKGYGFQWWTQDDGAYQAHGIFGQGIFIDPSRNLVIATNGNWTSALGDKDGEFAAEEEFHLLVQQAIDREEAKLN